VLYNQKLYFLTIGGSGGGPGGCFSRTMIVPPTGGVGGCKYLTKTYYLYGIMIKK
jgi:hypothetical protein